MKAELRSEAALLTVGGTAGINAEECDKLGTELDSLKSKLTVVTKQRDYAIRLLRQRGVSMGVSATSLDMGL